MFVIWSYTRDSTFLHSTFNFDLCNIQVFAFDIQLSTVKFQIRSSSSVERTFIFSHPKFSTWPLSFRFRNPTLGIVLASFGIRHSTFRIEFLPAGQRAMETHPCSNGGWESVKRLPSGVDSGDLLHSRQTRRWQTCSRPCDKSSRSPRCCCTC